MKKLEYMDRLAAELKKRNVADADDILEEYEQHFACKLADGYSEEEIAAKLGAPETLAEQFGEVEGEQAGSGRRSAALTWLWLVWADLFFGIFAVLLAAFGVVLAACVVSFGVTGVCLIGDLGRLPIVSLPAMPYWCGAILGLSMLALCALSVTGCAWFFAFMRQLFRAYGRFHRNALAPCRGAAVLPSLPMAPQLAPKARRRLRTAALVSLVLFAMCFVLTYVVCSLSAGSLEFWHTWGWFGYQG